MINDTIRKFGYPETLVREYAHWVLLLRPAQPTLGSLVMAARGDATAFGDLAPEAHAELAVVTRDIETALKHAIAYERINYLMLMMVDPHVHFHVIPRYADVRSHGDLVMADAGWPKPPALGEAVTLDAAQVATLVAWLQGHFAS